MDIKVNKKYFSKIGFSLFWGTIITIIAQFAGGFIIAAINPDLMENFDISMASTMLPMYLIGLPVLMLLLIKRTPAGQIEKRTMSAGKLTAAAMISYALVILGNLAGLGTTAIIALIKGEPVLNPLADIVLSGNIWITSIYTVLCAPIFEEIIFRKLLLDRTVKYGEAASVIFSGALFGLFHGNLNQFVYAFILGVFFAFIYVKTGEVKYCIILHMFINFMGSFASGLILQYFDVENMPGIVINNVFNIIAILMVVAGIIILLNSIRKFTFEKGELELEKGERFKTMFLNGGMICYSLFWIANMVILLIV